MTGQQTAIAATTPAPVAPDRSFALDGNSAWLVSSGHVDVFYVDAREGDHGGRRTHLLRANKRQPLFGATSDAFDTMPGSLRAICGNGARVRQLSSARFDELRAHPKGRVELCAGIDAWVDLLCRALAKTMPPEDCEDLVSAQRLDIDAGKTFRPAQGVAWIVATSDQLQLFGQETLALPAGLAIPIAARAWISSADATSLELLPTHKVLDCGEAWHGLAVLQQLAIRRVAAVAVDNDARERQRQDLKIAAGRSRYAAAMLQIASGLEAAEPHAVDAPTSEARTRPDAINAVCALVGKSLGLTLASQRLPDPGNARFSVELVARGSGCRTRRVRLTEGWWREDLGPLVAFAADDGRPVALLPDGSSRYVMHDCERNGVTTVDRQLAAQLSPGAVCFYRSFPHVVLKIGELLRFGAAGCTRDIATAGLVGAVAGLLATAPPLATATLYNSIIPGAERTQLVQLLLVLVAAAVGAATLQITRAIAMVRIETRMGSAIQAAVWDRLLSLPPRFFRDYSAGNLAVRAMGVSTIQQALSSTAARVALSSIFSIFNYALLFYYDPLLAGYASLLMVGALAATTAASAAQLRYQREVSQLRAKTTGLVLQFLTGIAKLRVAGVEVVAFSKWAELFGAQRQAQYKARRIANAYTVFNSAFPVMASLVVFAAVANRASGDVGLRVGDFLGFMAAFATCLSATLATGTAVVSLLAIVPVYELAKPILTTLPEVTDGKLDPGTLTGEIKIDHAVFRYQSGGPPILQDVSVHVRPGEFVALVGASGSGKSTLLRLLLGFDIPESGSIYYDGQDLQDLDVQKVRRQIGVVLQGGRLGPGDMFSQIAGAAGGTIKDAWDAARRAGLEDDIKQMPMGMHTVVDEGGGTLSGGQRQRLMIARALVTRPKILFLDEATSALDNRTQALVTESLEKLKATRVVVAHRLSTIAKADRIYVIERGAVAETGTYHELMEKGGIFATLAHRQIA